MSLTGLNVPLLRKVVGGAINWGTLLVIEFEPDSLWYETSLTIAAQALREGIKTIYHVFQHHPDEVRRALAQFGLDTRKLQDDGKFVIADSYTVQTGLGLPEKKEVISESLKVSDWSLEGAQELKSGIPEAEKRWLHIDENLGVLLQYNQEKSLIDFWRTRKIAEARAFEDIGLHSFLKGVASDAFYRQFESLCDGIVDVKREEKGAEIEHLLRVRALRGKKLDARWHPLQLQDNGEVTLAD